MYLTKEEEKLLESENETIRKCMEILVAEGEAERAERLVEVKSAHISGVSYDNIGDAGLEWLESLKAEVKIPATLNPAGMDLKRWREMGIDEEFYEKQMRILRVFERLKVRMLLTCTPYYILRPNYGDHLAWAESSAVVYANSIIGARTNRECGPTALAAAIIGKIPYFGMHIKENRAPTVLVRLKGDIVAAGFNAAKELRDEIPYFVFERRVSEDELKLLGATLAANGNTPMFHAENYTPEWRDFEKPREKVEFDDAIVESCEPDLITIGCPHVSEKELRDILKLMDGRRAKREFWVFVAREIAERNGEIVRKLEELNVKVFSDTCMVVSPATSKFRCVMVNSGKALHYLPKNRKVEVVFGELRRCVEIAVSV